MWYFRPTRWLPLKLLLAAYFLWSIGFTVFYGAIRSLAVIKLAWAIPASLHFLLPMLTFLPTVFPLLGIQMAPLGFYVWQAAGISMVWNDSEPGVGRKIAVSAVILVLGYFIALGFAWLGVVVIGKIADLNPCAALAAGVTGSKPPTTCP